MESRKGQKTPERRSVSRMPTGSPAVYSLLTTLKTLPHLPDCGRLHPHLRSTDQLISCLIPRYSSRIQPPMSHMPRPHRPGHPRYRPLEMTPAQVGVFYALTDFGSVHNGYPKSPDNAEPCMRSVTKKRPVPGTLDQVSSELGDRTTVTS